MVCVQAQCSWFDQGSSFVFWFFLIFIFLTTVSFTTWLTLTYLCYNALIYTAVNAPSVSVQNECNFLYLEQAGFLCLHKIRLGMYFWDSRSDFVLFFCFCLPRCLWFMFLKDFLSVLEIYTVIWSEWGGEQHFKIWKMEISSLLENKSSSDFSPNHSREIEEIWMLVGVASIYVSVCSKTCSINSNWIKVLEF